MTDCCLRYAETADETPWSAGQLAAGRRIDAYLAQCAAFICATFEPARDEPSGPGVAGGSDVDDIIRVLLRREFNYQSTGRVAHLLPELRRRIERIVRDGRPLPIYYLYHGGYRASTGSALGDLAFAPDATDLLAIHQVARLQRAMVPVHAPGLSFRFVINNGVAARTNDIPYAATCDYAARLDRLIDRLGATAAVRVLVQSALATSGETLRGDGEVPVDPATHRAVERFLGRTCLPAEAQERANRYVVEELAWGRQLGAIIDEASGFAMRQVAHPACLSFRPFPGGAIRVQNGSIGFRLRDDDRDPVPFLVTATTHAQRELLTVPVRAEVLLPDMPLTAGARVSLPA